MYDATIPTHRFVVALAAVAATIVASTVVNPGISASASESEAVTSSEMVTALEGVGDGLVRDAVSTATPPIALDPTSSPEALALDIPSDPADGVRLAVGDFSLTIGLPHSEDAASATSTEQGIVTYPSEGESANAVIPVAGGVQLLSVIETREAAESYSYPLTLPSGHVLETTPDGGARVVDSAGTVKAAFEPAWAKDAEGKPVPTRYVVHGGTLTQIVDHRHMSDVVYPVVADPLPVILIVVTAAAAIIVAAAALGIATWIVINWWNYCRARNMYPELSTRNGFTARCVR
ncbi:MAG: hypothetical protein J0I95_08855 [Microbacterium sp.]|uniref:hypothetical protein n=1 Tax=Microbacterium sp. TaxID=51671 RepID=UPI001ACF19A2|nr:hypothetical protein [Microbacterium sp.]MBN9211608.1 hypothetical protein [Microbacterium sp.]